MRISRTAIAVSRLLLRAALRDPIRRNLRQTFRMLDESIPRALQLSVAPIIVQSLIVDAITKSSGVRPTIEEVEVVAALFDPLLAAVPLSRRKV
jgi:hypothetical protein